MGMETMLIIAAFAAVATTLVAGSMGCAVYGMAKAQSRIHREERSVAEAVQKARKAAARRARKPAVRKPAVKIRRPVADPVHHAAM
ncbi:hypothetical protein J5J10_12420 [Ciceribacter sp. L1K23]|uniref:hypothetical protein n=1 Tax=unclassified Ciceribacter TaxID=2628820 RepID=UPI001ABDCF5D|nr:MULTISPECIES: hypothetical protein [unclassified Ciceribacter]MBO3759362.1 hypothetical protein [Ciceribacter sp. L1K22]MBR0556483.1 hypothetical protein [Ciceribacter sp. L1K23]